MSIRDKYKPTPVATLRGVEEQEETVLGSGSSDYLKKVDGINKHRIFPAHPGCKSFFHIVMSHWLEFEKEGDVKRIKVNNAKIHGGQKQDVIEAYIDFVKANLDKNKPADKVKIDAIYDRNGSIVGKPSWVYYALSIATKKGADGVLPEPKFGLYEANRTIRDGINNLSGGEGEDEVVEFDPFTDPDTGKCLIFTYDSKAKTSNKYYSGIKLSEKPYKLSDDQLETFEKVKSLDELYDNVYGLEDFEKALKGLRYFDEKNEIYLFESDAFQEIVAELKAALSDVPVVKDVPSKKPVKTAKAAPKQQELALDDAEEENEPPLVEEAENDEEEDDEEAADEFAAMDRDELKLYKQKNFPDMKFLKSQSDDDLRDMLRNAVALAKINALANDAEEDEAEDAPEPPKKSTNKKLEDVKRELKLGKKG